jgi:hypothetical protein
VLRLFRDEDNLLRPAILLIFACNGGTKLEKLTVTSGYFKSNLMIGQKQNRLTHRLQLIFRLRFFGRNYPACECILVPRATQRLPPKRNKYFALASS